MKKKWFTTTRYVHRDTGEIILKSQWIREDYYLIETLTEIKFNEKFNEKIIIKAGKPSGQIRLFKE